MIEEQLNKLGLSPLNTYYWEYQYKLGKEYIVPHLQHLGFSPKGKSVCEIGSAEGGVLFAIKESGAMNCLATDIAQSRLDAGELIAKNFGYSINFVNHNIIEDKIPSNWLNCFDLVILRDVIEHLDDARMALTNLKKIM
ncbi:MAG: class I SAM-dependent methyltransferase, partial [Candidatus Kapaibacteriota bacterium]